MSTLRSLDMRWLIVVAPLCVFGCSKSGDGGGSDDGDDGAPPGCMSNDDCRTGRLCIDRDGNLDDICDEGETCVCTTVTGTGGSSGSSTGGTSTGGASEGGANDGGSSTGGSSEGGSTTGGSATGGNATGGNATGGSATGGSSGADACGAYCDRLVGAMCAAINETACLADCNGFSADCPTELAALSACVANPANTITCVTGQAQIQGCDAPIEATDRCLVCVPETADTGCQMCTKANCCETVGDYALAPDGAAFYACATACTTDVCFDGCLAMYPTAGDALLALAACQDTSCPEPCICGAETTDNACVTCAKTTCCSEFVDYSLAPSAAEFDACIAVCTDAACDNACVAQYPEAGAAFIALSDCLGGSCLDACSM